MDNGELAGLAGTLGAIRTGIDFPWYSTHWRIGNVRGGATDSLGFGFAYSADGTTWTSCSYIKPDGTYMGTANYAKSALKAEVVSKNFARDSSNATNMIAIYDTNGTTLRGLMGFHNTGGDGTGSAYIIPYPATTDTWGGTEGLYISKGVLRIDGANVLTSSNYSSYTVTKTGSGASGTWGISISGNATSATKLATARNIFGRSFNGEADIAGKGTFYGSYNSTANSRYSTAALEIRENGLVGTAQTDIAYAPQIGFHWSGKVAGQLALGSDAKFRFITQGGGTATLIANLEGNATSAGSATTASKLSGNNGFIYGASTFQYFDISGTAGAAYEVNDTPTSAWWYIQRHIHSNSSSHYYTDVAIPFNANSIYYKRITAGTVQNNGWVKVLDSLNYTSYTVKKDGTGASGSWGINITGSSASCTGNAATATKATQDANGATISSTYLKLSGGTMTGHITMDGANQVKSANVGSSYWKSRDVALIRHTTHIASSSYSAIYSMKGLSGDFACGLIHYASGESKIEWRYTTDATYNAGLNDGSSLLMQLDSYGSLLATKVYGAVWNDYAEYRETTTEIEPGRVVIENGNDTLSLCQERLMATAQVVSDTFGFAIGETDNCKTPLAVSGRVLVYTDMPRETF